MNTLGEQVGYGKEWSPLEIDLKLVNDILKEVIQKHDVQDPGVADSLSKRLLTVADHLSSDLTKLKIYYVSTRSRAKDRLNDVKNSCIDEKSDAGKERVALCDLEFRKQRDEYKKAELLMGHLEIKYRELMSFHYSFKDTARRLAGMNMATSGGSESDKHDIFNVSDIPLSGESQAKEEKEPF